MKKVKPVNISTSSPCEILWIKSCIPGFGDGREVEAEWLYIICEQCWLPRCRSVNCDQQPQTSRLSSQSCSQVVMIGMMLTILIILIILKLIMLIISILMILIILIILIKLIKLMIMMTEDFDDYDDYDDYDDFYY